MVNMDDGGAGGLGALIPGPTGADTNRDAQGGYGGTPPPAGPTGADTNRDAQGGYGGGGSTTTGGDVTQTNQDAQQSGSYSGVTADGRTVYNSNDPTTQNVAAGLDTGGDGATVVSMVASPDGTKWYVQMSNGTLYSVDRVAMNSGNPYKPKEAGKWGNGDGTGTWGTSGLGAGAGGTAKDTPAAQTNTSTNTAGNTSSGGGSQGGGGSEGDGSGGGGKGWNTKGVAANLGGYGDQADITAHGGAVATSNAPDGSVIVRMGDGTVQRVDPVTGKLTPYDGSSGTDGSSTVTSGSANSGGSGDASAGGTYSTTDATGKTVYNANDPATQNIGQAVPGDHKGAQSMYQAANGNWVVTMGDGTTWEVNRNGGPKGVNQLTANNQPAAFTSTTTGGAVATGGGTAKPPANVNPYVMPSSETPPNAIGPGGTPKTTGITITPIPAGVNPYVMPSTETPPGAIGPGGTPTASSMQAPPGVVGKPVETSFIRNGTIYWVLSDGKVYAEGSGGVYYMGDYGTVEQAKAKFSGDKPKPPKPNKPKGPIVVG